MTLDGNGNAEQITETTPQGSTTVIQGFDDLDRLEASTDRFGRTLGYGYDANGNRMRQTAIPGTGIMTAS